MEKSISDIFFIAISLITTSALFILCYSFTTETRKTEISEQEINAFYEELKEYREWSKYKGQVTGADMIDFIMRSKDICDIVIHDPGFSLNDKIRPYLTDGKLIMGLADTRNIPETFWEFTFVFDNITGGRGDSVYTAALLYDGELMSGYDGGIQVRGGAVTGIEYKKN